LDIDKGRVGDFWNNKVLDWKPIKFSAEFIYRMRKIRKKLKNLPSTRQAVAIPKLITATYYRKNILVPEDFIKAAVITTPIEDQKIARKIAYDIIFEEKAEKKKEATEIQEEIFEDIDEEDMDFMDEFLNIHLNFI